MSSFGSLLQGSLSWEIELTTRCNSHCVGCSRYSDYFHPNIHFDPRQDLDFATFKKALASGQRLDFILLCGVYGDPLLHPEIVRFMQHIRSEYPEAKVSAHSNGAFGTPELWKSLAAHFNTPGSHIKFSIDGLKNSHELFRQGTRWESVLKNAEVFIQAGGNAVWKMIEFKHNQIDIAEARNLATEMGFRSFELRSNNFPGLDDYITLPEDDRKSLTRTENLDFDETALDQWNTQQVDQKKFNSIECRSLTRKNLYLDAHGKVWPCCWVGGLPYRPENHLRQWMHKKLLSRYSDDFNSLESYSLSEILDHEWMKTSLPESWKNKNSTEKNPLIATCAKTCGQCRT